MKVIISPKAEKQINKLSKFNQIIVAKKIRSIQQSKKIVGAEKLKGIRNVYRVRIGEFRIIYKKTQKEVYIILIGHRKDIYQVVKRLFS